MGIFGGRKQQELTPYPLKTGAAIPLTDVEPEYVTWVRESKPAGKFGHEATVRVELQDDHIVAIAGDGSVVARMSEQKSNLYRAEFEALRQRGHYGVAQIEVSPAGHKERVNLAINYDAGCRDGGIL
jgi:hypothetical protein